MKKLIWLFGINGSGKEELFNNAFKEEVKSLLNIENKNIMFLSLPYNTDNEFYSKNYDRFDAIYKYIEKFEISDKEVLLINGEYVDFNNNVFNIVSKVGNNFPEIEKEIFYITMSDTNKFYENLINTDWYNSKEESDKKKYPLEWLSFTDKYYKRTLKEFSKEGYIYHIIDMSSLEKEKTKVLKI